MKAIKETISSNVFDHRAYIAWAIYMCLVLSVLVYVYFMSVAVFNAARTESLTAETAVISTKSNDLETKYIELSNSVTLEKASALGFYDVAKPKFISRKTLGRTLSFSSEI